MEVPQRDWKRPEGGSCSSYLEVGYLQRNDAVGNFLAKFENCSDYYGWDTRKRLCHLRACLEGDAGQVLWDAGTTSSADDLIALLRNRLGSVNQAKDTEPS